MDGNAAPRERLLVDWVYAPPVGHAIEGLKIAADWVRVNPDLEVSVLLNAKTGVELAGCVFLHSRRDADAARFGECFEPRGDVHSITENIAILDNNVADVNTDTELDPIRRPGVSLRHALLDFHCAAQGIDNAAELHEETIAGRLHQPAMMLADFRVYYFGSNRPEPVQRSLFITPDQARIAGHIGCQDRRQPAFSADPLSRTHRSYPVSKPSSGSDLPVSAYL